MKNNFNLLTSNNKRSIKNILTIGLFAVVMISSLFSNGLIISQAMASGNTTSVANNTSTTSIDNTSLTVVANPNTVQAGGQVTLTATIIDSSSSPTSPTGSVSWSDGNKGGLFSSTSCNLSSGSCIVSYTSSIQSQNSITISVAYGGDTTHKISSGTLSLVVISLHPTSVSVTSSSTSSVSGNPITITSTVTDTSNSLTTPAGAISWGDQNAGGSFSPSTCTLSTGMCTTLYTPSANSPSNVIIIASYGGDTTHNTSSSTLSLVVAVHTTSVIVTPNSGPFVSGTAVAFSVTVTDTSNSPTSPTGIVSWSDGNAGGSFSSTACTLSANTCTTSYTPSSNSPNSITITATYGGDTTHQTNSGTSQILQTTGAASVLITSSASAISSGGQVTVTAIITDPTNSQNIPTGAITWSDGNIGGSFSSSSCNLSSGTCNVTYTAPSNVPTSITITASYGGDSSHAVNSGTSILTTNSLSSVSITVSPNPASYVTGTVLTYTVTIADTSNSQNIPTGAITWSDGNVGGIFSSPSCTLASGTCTTSYTPSTNSPINVVITANYGGDTTHQTSSATSNLTISTIHATAVSVTSNPTTVPLSGSMNVTVTVTDSSSSPIIPTSSVSWSDGIGGGTFNPSSCTLSSSGSCTVSYTPSANPPNAITITASYNGDTSHQASTGSSQLSANAPDSTTSTITPNPATFSPGTQVTFTLIITDVTHPSSNIVGLVKWTDNGSGGSFSPDACILTSNHCALAYTPPSSPSGSITISASYPGDTTHLGSSTTSVLTVNGTPSPATQPSTTQPSTTQSNTPSSTQSTPATQPSTTQSNTPAVKSNTQSTPQSTPNPSQTNGNTNQQPQSNPIAVIGQVINKVVSELEALFNKI
jgi:hypothetical protein